MKRNRVNRRKLVDWQIFASFVFGIGTFVIAYIPFLQEDVSFGTFVLLKAGPNYIVGSIFSIIMFFVMWRINLEIIRPVNNHRITVACSDFYHKNGHYFPYDQLTWLEGLSFEDVNLLDGFLARTVVSGSFSENMLPPVSLYDPKSGMNGYMVYDDTREPPIWQQFNTRYEVERLIELGLLRSNKMNLRPTNSEYHCYIRNDVAVFYFGTRKIEILFSTNLIVEVYELTERTMNILTAVHSKDWFARNESGLHFLSFLWKDRATVSCDGRVIVAREFV